MLTDNVNKRTRNNNGTMLCVFFIDDKLRVNRTKKIRQYQVYIKELMTIFDLNIKNYKEQLLDLIISYKLDLCDDSDRGNTHFVEWCVVIQLTLVTFMRLSKL